MLDLSNIPAKTLPEKKDTIKICGIEKEVTYTPLVGEKRLELFVLKNYDDRQEKELVVERIYLALMNGVGMTHDEVAKLIDLDWLAAMNLAGAVINFSIEFDGLLKDEEEKAEKNSDPEGEIPTPA